MKVKPRYTSAELLPANPEHDKIIDKLITERRGEYRIVTKPLTKQLQVKIRYADGVKPLERYSDGASGFDLCAAEDILLRTGESCLIGTGVYLEIPNGYEGQIRSRSGLASNGVVVANSPGTIDSDYRGEVVVILLFRWSGELSGTFVIGKGQRIAQLVFAPVEIPELVEVDELGETERGSGGFGSTGR